MGRIIYAFEEQVGELFTTTGKDAWRLASFCGYPTVTFENLETKEKVRGAVGSLIIDPFKRLYSF